MSELTTAILLVGHGSQRPETKVELDRTAIDLEADVGFGPVASAYMELAEPSISRALERFVEQGIRRILVVPWFLNTGRHLSEDIPAIVAAVAEANPDVSIRLLPHVGGHPGMIGLIADIVREAL